MLHTYILIYISLWFCYNRILKIYYTHTHFYTKSKIVFLSVILLHFTYIYTSVNILTCSSVMFPYVPLLFACNSCRYACMWSLMRNYTQTTRRTHALNWCFVYRYIYLYSDIHSHIYTKYIHINTICKHVYIKCCKILYALRKKTIKTQNKTRNKFNSGLFIESKAFYVVIFWKITLKLSLIYSDRI